ncbi:MAG: bifunctional phosphoribosylaminoimidazolecarboxamide formyltransferase/IMP cyclohydrolase [Rhodospirillales bacterium]|nr:bifunctional phosphoribosylaminoimidazolecarboxamide formyltransferase/IMP cyclohydrolase [Rhodospirillales bacterium]
MPDPLPVRRALISVSDKTGLVSFAAALCHRGVEILSTGGTAATLAKAGIVVKEVSAVSGFPEILDGRVKTLVPQIHGGLLARRDDPRHLEEMAEHGIAPIDLVAVNLYPFEATIARGAPFPECVENIDVGGPAMLRAAAKNHEFVVAVSEPEQYEAVLAELAASGGTSAAVRRKLAAAAFGRTAAYDAAIARWFSAEEGETFPATFSLSGRRAEMLRYGENPHQGAAFYTTGRRPGVATARQVQGKALSYNNINDTDAAYECVADFAGPSVVIVKHANPCGVASAGSLAKAWELALRCDPVSAFGGVVAMNRPLDAATAGRIAAIFTEVVIAPDASEEAKAVLAKKRNVRLLLAGKVPDPEETGLAFRSVAGGFLLQTRDTGRIGPSDLKVVTKRGPSATELEDLLFAFRVAKHVRSNTIVYAKDRATVGIGAGQMSRVDAARIAAWKAAEATRAAGLERLLTNGSAAASDAFFPFPDGLEAIAEAGATAVIQPGGSIRDDEVIAAADQAGMAMVFTGMRHFRH